ncbi:MAG: thioredoxin [Hyphomicrobiales bacterium]|nr:thioredoxin [Hyphomicrobiales bacterium]
MTEKAKFYHAGYPAGVDAEQCFAEVLDKSTYVVEIEHLDNVKDQFGNAEHMGDKSMPTPVIDGAIYHFDHGVDLSVLG